MFKSIYIQLSDNQVFEVFFIKHLRKLYRSISYELWIRAMLEVHTHFLPFYQPIANIPQIRL